MGTSHTVPHLPDGLLLCSGKRTSENKELAKNKIIIKVKTM